MKFWLLESWAYRNRFAAFNCLVFLAIFISWETALAVQEEPDFELYHKECVQGVTIYCLTLGMNEQKVGHKEAALKYYRLACENHHAAGHLRACTPFLGLALQMGRLAQAAVSLEKRCSAGDDVTCFYLGKEYLKITAYQQGYGHLEGLCHADFRPPDPEDYGPCYHLASSLRNRKQFEKAAEILKLDCQRDTHAVAPSCELFDSLMKQIKKQASEVAHLKKIKPVEYVLILFVALPLAGWRLLESGQLPKLQFLRLHFPMIILLTWGIWEFGSGKSGYWRTDLFFVIPAVLIVFLMAWLAHYRIQMKNKS